MLKRLSNGGRRVMLQSDQVELKCEDFRLIYIYYGRLQSDQVELKLPNMLLVDLYTAGFNRTR